MYQLNKKMFFASNHILKCDECEGCLEDPRILECGNSICSYCLALIQITNKRKFKCLICDQSHEMPESDYSIFLRFKRRLV